MVSLYHSIPLIIGNTKGHNVTGQRSVTSTGVGRSRGSMHSNQNEAARLPPCCPGSVASGQLNTVPALATVPRAPTGTPLACRQAAVKPSEQVGGHGATRHRNLGLSPAPARPKPVNAAGRPRPPHPPQHTHWHTHTTDHTGIATSPQGGPAAPAPPCPAAARNRGRAAVPDALGGPSLPRDERNRPEPDSESGSGLRARNRVPPGGIRR